jgi:hypothetical protein
MIHKTTVKISTIRNNEERDVLGRLLQAEYAYKELPEDFSPDDFDPEDDLESDDLEPEDDLESDDLEPEDDLESDDLEPEDDLESNDLEPEDDLESNDLEPEDDLESNDFDPEDDVFEPYNVLKLYSGLEIFNMDIPKESFLIENLITENSVNFIAGEPGCGKSLLAMNLGFPTRLKNKGKCCLSITNYLSMLSQDISSVCVMLFLLLGIFPTSLFQQEYLSLMNAGML